MIKMMKSMTIVAMLVPLVAAQQVSVLAPREIDKAHAKVEQTWTAWQEVRPEAHLLTKTTRQALTEISQSEAKADAYLDAKEQFYVRLSEAFHQQAESVLRENGSHLSAAALSAGEKQRLNTLLDRESTTRKKISDLEKQSNRNPRQQLELDSFLRQEKDLARLQDEVKKRVVTLDQLQSGEDQAAVNRTAIADRLEQIVQILNERAEETALEKTQWRNYHGELRELVVEKGGK